MSHYVPFRAIWTFGNNFYSSVWFMTFNATNSQGTSKTLYCLILVIDRNIMKFRKWINTCKTFSISYLNFHDLGDSLSSSCETLMAFWEFYLSYYLEWLLETFVIYGYCKMCWKCIVDLFLFKAYWLTKKLWINLQIQWNVLFCWQFKSSSQM